MPPIHGQPLSMLPMLTAMVEEARADSTDQLATFRAAQERPYSLDNATIAHAERVYSEQGQFLGIYAEQCRRWQQSTSSPRQQQALSHLASVVAQATAINIAILALLPELKDFTIERLLQKTDLELGIEALQGQKPRR